MLGRLRIAKEYDLQSVAISLMNWVEEDYEDLDYVLDWVRSVGLNKKSFNAFRGLNFYKFNLKEFVSKGSVKLMDKGLESWSTQESVASGSDFFQRGNYGILLSRRMNSGDSYIDVNESVRYLLLNDIDIEELSEGAEHPILDQWPECEIVTNYVCKECKIGENLECLSIDGERNNQDFVSLFDSNGWEILRSNDPYYGSSRLFYTLEKLGKVRIHESTRSASKYFRLKEDRKCRYIF